MDCDHANECPQVCPCKPTCVCRAGMCKDDRPVDRVQQLEAQVEFLLKLFAYEARVVEAHYVGYKSFPKGRRRLAEEQVSRMRMVALRKRAEYRERSVEDAYMQLKKEST